MGELLLCVRVCERAFDCCWLPKNHAIFRHCFQCIWISPTHAVFANSSTCSTVTRIRVFFGVAFVKDAIDGGLVSGAKQCADSKTNLKVVCISSVFVVFSIVLAINSALPF